MNLKSIAVSVFALGIMGGCSQEPAEESVAVQKNTSASTASAVPEVALPNPGKYLPGYEDICLFSTTEGYANQGRYKVDTQFMSVAHDYFSKRITVRSGPEGTKNAMISAYASFMNPCTIDSKKCGTESDTISLVAEGCAQDYKDDFPELGLK